MYTKMKFGVKCRDTGVALPQLKMGCNIICIMKVVIAVNLYTQLSFKMISTPM